MQVFIKEVLPEHGCTNERHRLVALHREATKITEPACFKKLEHRALDWLQFAFALLVVAIARPYKTIECAVALVVH